MKKSRNVSVSTVTVLRSKYLLIVSSIILGFDLHEINTTYTGTDVKTRRIPIPFFTGSNASPSKVNGTRTAIERIGIHNGT